jgi:Cys-tRNA(Pro)/Cys-tRNA(Cys) deacylase
MSAAQSPEPGGAAHAPLDLARELATLGLDAEIVAPGVPMPTVDAAATAMRVAPERIFKSVLFQSTDGACVMAVASGRGRIDAKRLASLAGTTRLRLAPPEVVLAVTGYPAGGTPPVGHRARFPVFVDTGVAGQDWGWAGGGREELLVRIAPADIVRLTGATIAELT